VSDHSAFRESVELVKSLNTHLVERCAELAFVHREESDMSRTRLTMALNWALLVLVIVFPFPWWW
jgi:hypothetical protein